MWHIHACSGKKLTKIFVRDIWREAVKYKFGKVNVFRNITDKYIFFMVQRRKEQIYKMISIIILKLSSRLPAKKGKDDYLQNFNFTFRFVWVRNLVTPIDRRSWSASVPGRVLSGIFVRKRKMDKIAWNEALWFLFKVIK